MWEGACPPMTVEQPIYLWLDYRYRGQAPSHIGSLQVLNQAFGSAIPWPICTGEPATSSSAHFTWSGPNSTIAV